MPICERCGSEHDGTFGSGRFCCSYCAATRYNVVIYQPKQDEEFRKIPAYKNYMVSNLGNVVYASNGNYFLIRQDTDERGYKRVTLLKNKKHKIVQVHRIVMLSFNPCENSNKLFVNHKDENASNNRLDNLEWCTHLYNVHYGTGIDRMKAHQHCKKVICVETGIVYKSMSEASRDTGVPLGNISYCCNGKLKSAGGYTWKYYVDDD